MHRVPSPELTPYELMVKRNIEENRRVLQSLGLLGSVEKVRKTVAHKPRVRISITPKRRNPNNGDVPAYYDPVRTRRSFALLESIGYEAISDENSHEPSQRRSKVIRENVFGEIEGVKIGDWWSTRMECSAAGVHRPTVAGISGKMGEGCYSIALSGGYEDDIDCGEYFTYTGSGGRDLKGTKANPKNLRTAPQSKDQVLDGMNAALASNIDSKNPVRVIRGFKLPSPYAPEEGYRYDGLYSVEKCWKATGLSGFKVCKFALKRLPSQEPPPWAVVAPLQEPNERSGEDLPLNSLSPPPWAVVAPLQEPNERSGEDLPLNSLSVADSNKAPSHCSSSPVDDGIKKVLRLSPTSKKRRIQSYSPPTTERISIIPTVNSAKELEKKSPQSFLKTSIDKENLLKTPSKDDHSEAFQTNSLNKSKRYKISKYEQNPGNEHLLISNTKTSPNGKPQFNDQTVDSLLMPCTNEKITRSRSLGSITDLSKNDSNDPLKINSGTTNDVTTFYGYSSEKSVLHKTVVKDTDNEIPTKVSHLSSKALSPVISEVSTNKYVSKLIAKTTSPQTELQSSIKGPKNEANNSYLEPFVIIKNTLSCEDRGNLTPTNYCSKSSPDQSILLSSTAINSSIKKVSFSPKISFQDEDGNCSTQSFQSCSDDDSSSFTGFDIDLAPRFRGFEEDVVGKEIPNYRLEPDSPAQKINSPDSKKQTLMVNCFKGLKPPTVRGTSDSSSQVRPKSLRSNQLFSSSPLSLSNKLGNHSIVEENNIFSAVNTSPTSSSLQVKSCEVVLEKLPFKNKAEVSPNTHYSPRNVFKMSCHKSKPSTFNEDVLRNSNPIPLAVQPTPKLSLMDNLLQQNKDRRRLYDTISVKRKMKAEILQACKPCNVCLVDIKNSDPGFKFQPSSLDRFPGFDENDDDLNFLGFNTIDIDTARKRSGGFKECIYNHPNGGFLGWNPAKCFQGSSSLVPVGFIINELSEN